MVRLPPRRPSPFTGRVWVAVGGGGISVVNEPATHIENIVVTRVAPLLLCHEATARGRDSPGDSGECQRHRQEASSGRETPGLAGRGRLRPDTRPGPVPAPAAGRLARPDPSVLTGFSVQTVSQAHNFLLPGGGRQACLAPSAVSVKQRWRGPRAAQLWEDSSAGLGPGSFSGRGKQHRQARRATRHLIRNRRDTRQRTRHGLPPAGWVTAIEGDCGPRRVRHEAQTREPRIEKPPEGCDNGYLCVAVTQVICVCVCLKSL